MLVAGEPDAAHAAREAEAAAQRGDLETAMRHWACMRSQDPADPAGYLRQGVALRSVGRAEEADRIFLEGIRNCADGFELLLEYCWVAHHRSDWGEALDRWSRLAAIFPGHSSGAVGVARCLIQLGRIAEAEQSVAESGFAAAGDVDAGSVFAELAAARGDWAEAVRRWGALRASHPDHARVIDGYGQALWQLNSAEAMDPQRRPAEIAAGGDAETRDLLLRFQSLGENCEFGLVQRRFGAEPIELFRWTYLPPHRATRLLQSRLAGIGALETTRLGVSHYGEYFVEDTQNELSFHTFVAENGADPAILLAQHRTRLERLKEKLLEDLQLGEHIFVCKLQYDASDQTVSRVQAAMREHGPGRLLCVRVKDDANPAGSLRVAADGVMYGYLDRVGPTVGPFGEVWDIAFDDWIAVCRQAVAAALT